MPKTTKCCWSTGVNPSVLRAFAVHLSERHRAYRKRRDGVGYGRLPLSFGGYLDCAASEVHVLYVDEIARGDLFGYQTNPGGRGQGTKASLDLVSRPHQHMLRFRPPPELDEQSVELDITSEEAGELMERMAAGPGTSNYGPGHCWPIPEFQLRDSGKWETLRHARVNLSEGASSEPRLEVSCLARKAAGLDNTPANVSFALLITIIDKPGHPTCMIGWRPSSHRSGRFRPFRFVRKSVARLGGADRLVVEVMHEDATRPARDIVNSA
jgi:hypothetical protein